MCQLTLALEIAGLGMFKLLPEGQGDICSRRVSRRFPFRLHTIVVLTSLSPER